MRKTKELTLIASLVALCFVLRYALDALPNIKPITAIIILASVFLSTRVGACTGALTMLISGILMGFGLWIPLQIIAYIIIAIGVKLLPNKNVASIAVYGFITPFIYVLITNLSMLPYIDKSSFVTLWISGLGFDLLHSISTVVFIVTLYKPFKHIAEKQIGRQA